MNPIPPSEAIKLVLLTIIAVGVIILDLHFHALG